MIYLKDRKDFDWLTPEGRLFLERGYLAEGQKAEGRVRQIADFAEALNGIEGFGDKFYNYVAKGYYSLSSPIWSNFAVEKGLPISCFGSYFGDSIPEIADTNSEIATMSKNGGGCSGYIGDIRARGERISNNGVSNGSISMLSKTESVVEVVSQGKSRKGHFAYYIPMDHGDIKEALGTHTEGHPLQLIHYGVVVSELWWKEMLSGDVEKQDLWALVTQRRFETGLPYILFEGNVNNNKPQVYKDKDMKILASNLCSEIMLPSSIDESFICCLSSMHLLYYEEWKDTDAVETLTIFLDTVLTEFINKVRSLSNSSDRGKRREGYHLKKALRFAERHRAIGVGALGWHTYLQNKSISFDSMEAMYLNTEIFKFLDLKTKKASQWLAKEFGEPDLLLGYGYRNTCRMSVAPTKSSSFILGATSQSIEPLESNYYIKDLAKIEVVYKNPVLERLLRDKYGKDNRETWLSIRKMDGSVQHLDFLTDHEKDVFKVFREVSQKNVIIQAAGRQKFIDQGQSLNITIHPKTPVKEVMDLYILAEEMGVKSLYYQNNLNAAQEFTRNSCTNCEG